MTTLAYLVIATFVVASLAGCALLYERSGAPRTWGRKVTDDEIDDYRDASWPR